MTLLLCLTVSAAFLSGCVAGLAAPAQTDATAQEAAAQTEESEQSGAEVDLAENEHDADLVPLSGSPAISTALMPEASGTDVRSNSKAAIDVSNTADGYVMVRYLQSTDSNLKVLVTGPSGVRYTYNLNASGDYEVFPLSDGSGTYKVGVYKNVEGTKYSVENAATLDVKLSDEFAPFLLPNQYVNYSADSEVVKKAAELTAGCRDELESIQAVYNFVVGSFTYDTQRAQTVQSSYLPDLDSVLAEKKGICFDYAAVMTAMLRSQGIPCKLVVGYAGTVYHAWINAYSQEKGWISNAIYFDGSTWKLMDPTFASTGKSSASVMKYITDSDNYTAKYLY